MKHIRLNSNEIRSFLMAVGTGTLVMVLILVIPRGIFETLLGDTGIFQIMPVAAPMDDFAHTISAFIFGTAMFILMLAVQIRAGTYVTQTGDDDAVEDDQDIDDGAGKSVSWINGLKFPFSKRGSDRSDSNVITILDVPKLRANDAHPDAPPRRPIFANDELKGADLVGNGEDGAPIISGTEEVAHFEEANTEPVTLPKLNVDDLAGDNEEPLELVNRADEHMDGETGATPSSAKQAPPAKQDEGSLAEMVAQLEASVEQRKAQLAQLEIVAAKIAERKVGLENGPVDKDDLPPKMMVPPLAAVPSSYSAEEEDGMDAALDAALQTLNRMNSKR